MKVEIVESKENPLLKRKEIVGLISHEGEPTPSKASVQAYISKIENVDPKHVDVKKIFSPKSGILQSKILVYIWEEKEVPVLEEKKAVEKEGEGEKPEESSESAEGQENAENEKDKNVEEQKQNNGEDQK